MIKLNVECLKKMLNSAQILLYLGSYRYFQPGRDKIEWDNFDRMAWNWVSGSIFPHVPVIFFIKLFFPIQYLGLL